MNDTEFKKGVQLLMEAASQLYNATNILCAAIGADTAEDKPIPAKPAVDKDTLREKLTKIVNDGRKDVVQTFLSNYNAQKLSEVPESRYADLYMDIEEYENAHA